MWGPAKKNHLGVGSTLSQVQTRVNGLQVRFRTLFGKSRAIEWRLNFENRFSSLGDHGEGLIHRRSPTACDSPDPNGMRVKDHPVPTSWYFLAISVNIFAVLPLLLVLCLCLLFEFRFCTQLHDYMTWGLAWNICYNFCFSYFCIFLHFIRTIWMDEFPKSEPVLSITCCAGPDLYSPIGKFQVTGIIWRLMSGANSQHLTRLEPDSHYRIAQKSGAHPTELNWALRLKSITSFTRTSLKDG